MPIFFGKDNISHGYRPFDVQIRIIPCDCTFSLRVIELITFILENRIFTQNDKTMGHSLGYKKLTMVFLCQLTHLIFAVCRRTFAKINHYIQHLSLDNSNKFALRVGRKLVTSKPVFSANSFALKLSKKYPL